MGERTGPALLAAALVLALLGMARELAPHPWQHSWLGHNGARYAHIARNHLRAEGLAAALVPRLDVAGSDPRAPEVYAHHPPGLTWLLAAVFAVTAVDETAARGLAAAASLLSLGALYRLMARATDRATAGVAALATAALPMTTVYGAHVDVQGPLVLAASLGVLLGYVRWLEGRGSLLALLGWAALASTFDWYGLYATALVGLEGCRRRERRGGALLLLLASLLLCAAWIHWLGHLPGASLARLGDAAHVRGPAALLGDLQATGAQLATWWRHSQRLLPGGPALLLLAAAAVLGWVGKRKGETPVALGPRVLVALLLAPPLLHGLLFPAGLLLHSYWLFGLPCGLGAGLALACRSLASWVGPAAAGGLVLAGAMLPGQPLPDPPDEIPVRLGRLLAEHTASGEIVLTNYDCNPLIAGGSGDEHLFLRPALTFYADRPVRGRVVTGAALEDARRRLPLARWFLLVPWPAPDPTLIEALAASRDDARTLHTDPLVQLLRL